MYTLRTKTVGKYTYDKLSEARADSLKALRDGEFVALSNQKGVLLCL